MRLGAPVSQDRGVCLETTCKGQKHRISLRAWCPTSDIPAQHFSLEELAAALGLIVPEKSQHRRGKGAV